MCGIGSGFGAGRMFQGRRVGGRRSGTALARCIGCRVWTIRFGPQYPSILNLPPVVGCMGALRPGSATLVADRGLSAPLQPSHTGVAISD